MKLVYILARELKEWPEDCEAIAQDRFSSRLFKVNGPAISTCVEAMAEDANTAKVTRAQWQDAVDALNTGRAGSGGIKWNGEGLPPVGTVCEVQHPDKPDTWCKCTILVWDSECAVFSADANYPFAYDGNGYPESFRQIRTPEQIAAEAREKAINAMAEILTHDGSFFQDAERLYDAGYRLFEIVDN